MVMWRYIKFNNNNNNNNKGSTFLSEVIYGFQQLLQVSTKDAEIVDYSTKTLASFDISWGL